MIVKADVRMAIELAYELSQQIAQLDLASAFPAFSQPLPSAQQNSKKSPPAKS
jgi:hypothetical protein